MITRETVTSTVKFSAFYVCWLQYVVCSETQAENTVEHCRLSQYDAEYYRTLQAVTI